jgi:hypothetical protein
LLQRDLESFNVSFTQADAVVCDGIFHSVTGINPILISKHVATRSHPLTDQQVEENKIIEDARRKSFSHSMLSFRSSNDFFVR